MGISDWSSEEDLEVQVLRKLFQLPAAHHMYARCVELDGSRLPLIEEEHLLVEWQCSSAIDAKTCSNRYSKIAAMWNATVEIG